MRHLKVLFASVLFSTAILTTSALAIPVAGDYTLASAFLNGTFTSNGTSLTNWSFTTNPASLNFTNLTVPFQATNIPLVFSHNVPTLPPRDEITIMWNPDSSLNLHSASYFASNLQFFSGPATSTPITATPGAIPEPATGLLLATGLLGLAGYRWRQRRRERTQVA